MKNTNEKYPLLTAWLGFMAIMSVGALIISLTLTHASSSINTIVQFTFIFVGGFFILKLMLEHHVLIQVDGSSENQQPAHSLTQQFSILAVWIGFIILNIFPMILIQWVSNLTPYPFNFLVTFGLGIFVGYFIFAFLVNWFIVSRYSTTKLK